MVVLAVLFCLCVALPLLELKVLFYPFSFVCFSHFFLFLSFISFFSLTLSSQIFVPGDEHVIFSQKGSLSILLSMFSCSVEDLEAHFSVAQQKKIFFQEIS